MKSKNYWLIFEEIEKGVGKMICIVSDEDIAKQFCRDFKGYYYMPRESFVEE